MCIIKEEAFHTATIYYTRRKSTETEIHFCSRGKPFTRRKMSCPSAIYTMLSQTHCWHKLNFKVIYKDQTVTTLTTWLLQIYFHWWKVQLFVYTADGNNNSGFWYMFFLIFTALFMYVLCCVLAYVMQNNYKND